MSVGQRQIRRDAPAKVTGHAIYPGDIQHADALHAKVVFSDQPHARMVSMSVDAARAIPGVVLVLTAADVPLNEYGLTMFDQPVLIGLNDNGASKVPCDISRWEADHIAVVIAETRAAAEAGAAAISVTWEELPVVGDLITALTDEVIVRPDINPISNTYWTYRLRKGCADSAWAQADVIVEGDYEFPYQEHAYLQPEAAVSFVDDESRITVQVAGQWTHEDQEQIAHALRLPLDQIRVIYPAIGGAFGGREDMSLQIVMALATLKLREVGIHRPVRCQWSREESMVGHHKRHRGKVHARWGATSDGKVIVAEADGYLDAGPYNYTSNKVLGNLHMCVCGPYEIEHLRVDSHAVFTHAVPGGAFRGFGGPQGAFVAEMQMSKLAAALNADPVQIRLLNSVKEGSIGHTGTDMPPGVSLPVVIQRCADEGGWSEPLPDVEPMTPLRSLPPEPRALRRGRGFSCGYKNVGFSFGFPERCEARIVLHGDDKIESVEFFHSGADVGQGGHTVFTQMAAEAVGVPFDQVETVFSDTAHTGDSGSASASRLTWMSGNAILGAAEEADKAWRNGDRPAVGDFRYTPPPTDAIDDVDSFGGIPNFAYTYGAQMIDLTVDIDTGHIVVHHATCAVDVGKAINPALVLGQIEGAVVQAHGYTITEDLQVRDARMVNPRFSTYLMPGFLDIPQHTHSVIVEEADPRGPWGARGMAEMPMLTYAPAVCAALFDATGVWFHKFPLTPDHVVATLRAAGVR
jgi:CO/xanthine dehydrogenase Mo-binding subunit